MEQCIKNLMMAFTDCGKLGLKRSISNEAKMLKRNKNIAFSCNPP